MGLIPRHTQSWESFHLLWILESGQRPSGITLEEPPCCLSISSHMFTHELPPPCVFIPLPACKSCHAVCVSQIPHRRSCQLCIPALPTAASRPSCGCQSGILPLQAEKSPLSYNPVQPSPLQTCQYLHAYFVGVFVKLFISIHCLAS